jgi:hypothetical protein
LFDGFRAEFISVSLPTKNGSIIRKSQFLDTISRFDTNTTGGLSNTFERKVAKPAHGAALKRDRFRGGLPLHSSAVTMSQDQTPLQCALIFNPYGLL